MRAVLDLGTNSVRLLAAHVSQNKIEPLIRETRVTRLGQGVDKTKVLSEAGMKRTLKALAELIALIPDQTPTSLLATSAVRDAKNGLQFAQMVKERVALPLQILSGAEEAKLSFAGAVFSLKSLNLPGPLSVVDIGGGSTEIYTGLATGELLGGGSVQVGAVRMLERCISTHPLLPSEQHLMEAEIENLLRPLSEENLGHRPETLIAVGGTATSLAAMIQSLEEYGDEKVTGFAFSFEALANIYAALGRLSLEERRQIPSLQRGREDVIVCGAAILFKAVEQMGFARVYTSVGDLLYGQLLAAGR